MGQSLASADEVDEDWNFFDKYEVAERIGVGCFGEVRACWRRLDFIDPDDDDDEDGFHEPLAVKIVDQYSKAALAQQAFMTAREEAEILHNISHPHIVELVDVFEDARFLFVVMELVSGGELFKAIAREERYVTEGDMARVAVQLMQALAYLHGQASVVHRDVKAQNILLTEPPDYQGRLLESMDIKLIDFGLAAVMPRRDCPDGGLARHFEDDKSLRLACGTPVMAPPEMWSSQENALDWWKELYGTKYGSKVDLWSAGCVLYLALLGRLPYCDRDADRLAAAVCDPDLEPSFVPAVGSYQVTLPCKSFLVGLLEKDPDDRMNAVEALQHPWLAHLTGGRGARRTRGLGAARPVPAQVRMMADREADAVVRRVRPEEGAARQAAFEKARAEALAQGPAVAAARRRPSMSTTATSRSSRGRRTLEKDDSSITTTSVTNGAVHCSC